MYWRKKASILRGAGLGLLFSANVCCAWSCEAYAYPERIASRLGMRMIELVKPLALVLLAAEARFDFRPCGAGKAIPRKYGDQTGSATPDERRLTYGREFRNTRQVGR